MIKRLLRSLLVFIILGIMTMAAVKTVNHLYPWHNVLSRISDAISGVRNEHYKSVLALVNRTHSLEASYVPDDLVVVRARMVPNITSDEKMMRSEAAKAVENLIKKADQQQISLYCVSGYRSYAMQKTLYEWTVKSSGQAIADLYTAHPGQSEHQTGLAMDLTNGDGAQGELVEAFGRTPEGIWLANNAANFGFVLRYPQGKEQVTGYNYEPWHIRYVGVAAAKEMKSKSLVLEEYAH